MTSDFDFESMPNSARGTAEETTPRAEPLVENPSASTSTQNYAFGINAIPLPKPPQEQAPIRRMRQKTPPPRK
jgi:hypothetical protein